MHRSLTYITVTGGKLALLLLLTAHARCCTEFISQPGNITVKDGESFSFSCVAKNEEVNQWYIDGVPLGASNNKLKQENYVLWNGCNVEKMFCGGTLFIKHADKTLDGSKVLCQVLCEDDNGEYHSILSQNATITVLPEEESSILHSVVTSSPSPSPTMLVPPTRKPSSSPKDSQGTEASSMEVTDVLAQRIPLIATVASVCFVLGCVFGTVCVVTIGRGRKRNQKPKKKVRTPIDISYPLQPEPDPTYSELIPQSSSDNSSNNRSDHEQSRSDSTDIIGIEGGRVYSLGGERDYVAERLSLRGVRSESRRRYNDYMELGMAGTPQRFNDSNTTSHANSRSSSATGRANGDIELTCRDIQLLQSCSCSNVPTPPEPPPLPARTRQCSPKQTEEEEDSLQCSTCIEVDLDELERAVQEQD